MPSQIEVVRYHSLLIEFKKNTETNNTLIPTAYTEKGELMAFSHITLPIKAIQFHPEAALTEYGLQMLENWISLIK
jgi:anthranilate/para-aminobenzoate synthase component II